MNSKQRRSMFIYDYIIIFQLIFKILSSELFVQMINFSKSANPTSIYFNFSPFEFYSRSKVLEVNPQTCIPTICEGSLENKSNILNLQITK